jgi:hypothetical protein
MTLGFGQVVIDSQRADDIAAFWSALLERPVLDGANQFFAMIPASEDRSFPALMFLAVPEPRQSKNRMHLDLVATDIQAEVERAISLGATKVAEFDEYGTRWTTMTDPEGNVFDAYGKSGNPLRSPEAALEASTSSGPTDQGRTSLGP